MIDFQEIKNIFTKYSDCLGEIKKTTTVSLFPLQIINDNIGDSKFCPVDIKDYVMKCNNYMQIESKQFKNNKITYHILWENDLPVCMSALIKSLRQALVTQKVFKIKKHMKVYIILSPFKRYFPNTKTEISCQHINGGFTSKIDNKIFILRSEEFSKVIIHELLHHCKFIDNNSHYGQDNIKLLKAIFNIDSNTLLLPNEAVVEFWATILHTLFVSYDYKISFEELLDIEKHFSIRQYKKLIKKQDGNLWKESTNSYAYIIFKTIFLCNMNVFLKTVKYPYDVDDITRFLIKYKTSISNLESFDDNSYAQLFEKTRLNDSLRMMYLSDY